MSGARFEAQVLVRRRNPWALALAGLPLMGALLLAFATAIDGGAWIAFAPHLTLVGAAALIWVLRQNPLALESSETITVADGVLHVGGEAIPLGRIARAALVPGPGLPRVNVELRGPNLGPIEIVTHVTRQGRAILRALGFDASQRSFVTRAASWLRASWPRWTLSIFALVGTTIAAMVGGGFVGIPPFFALLALLVPFVALASWPTRVEVGRDGVYLHWLHSKRFVPLASIRSATLDVQRSRNNQRVTVRLGLVSSDVIDISMGTTWDLTRAQALLERIEEVRSDVARGLDVAEASDVAVANVRERLARTAATTAEWLRALRTLGSGVVATHRTAPVAPEVFLRVVEDPSMKPTERAAAAIALVSSGDGAMKERIRIATETVAQPKLRVALEKALEEDEAELQAAVEELVREER
jgi:hypothetical protein